MGSIRGDLSLIGLADLFQLLGNHRRVGTLTVADPDSRKSIYFGTNGLLLLSDGKRKGPRIGEILLRTKRLSPPQIERVAAVQKQWRARFGETVVKMGYLTREEMIRAVQEQVEEEIYDLFSWADATFEFVEGPPPAILQDPDQPVAVLTTDVTALILEALRRVDEWQMISRPLGETAAVFELTDELSKRMHGYASDPLILTVAQLIDGRRTVGKIVEESRASRFQVYRALYQLHRDGCLRQVAAAPVPQAAAPAAGTTPAAVRAPGTRTLVVVGTVAGFRHELCEDLKKAGYEAIETGDEKAALEAVRGATVHAILLDAPPRLEGLWGILLHLNAMTNVPILVMSPSREREDILQAIRSGARDYVVKPFARHDLYDRLQKLWEGGGRTRTESTIIRGAAGMAGRREGEAPAAGGKP